MALKSKLSDVTVSETLSWPEYVYQHFDKYGNRTAIVDAISGRSYSYNQLTDLTRRLSSALFKRGFRKGEVLAIYLPNVIEYPIIFYGVAFLGGVLTTVNPLYSTKELRRQLKICGAKYLVTIPPLAEKAKDAAAMEGILTVLVIGEAQGCISLSTLLSDDGTAFPKNVEINTKEDLVVVPFSSGTTGLPKGVMISHFNLVAGTTSVVESQLLQESKTLLFVLPFYHSYGLYFILGGNLCVGSKIVILPRFDPKTFLQAMQDYKISFAPLVPPLVLFLAKHPLVEQFDLSSLTNVASGAAPLGHDMEIAITKRLPNLESVYQGFGMTELGGVSHAVLDENYKKPGSIGVLMPNLECKVINPDTGAILGPNQDGEICVRGPIVMKGYLNNPEATARTIDKDGWLHTGDIGHYDQDEYFFIVDRLKELIKYKGFQVPPAELEALLISHPNIDDAAVIGVPDVESGELPKAFVVRHGELTSEDVIKFVARHVPPHKKLRGGVEFVDQIPKSASGKILRRELRSRHKRSKL